MGGVVAAAVTIAVVATHIDSPSAVDPESRFGIAMWSYPARTPSYAYAAPAFTPTTTSTWTPPATLPLHPPPATVTPPTPVPVGGVLPPNGSVIMRGDSGEEMTLTVADIANPAPTRDPDDPDGPTIAPRLGHRLVSVVVRVENTGGVPFIDDIERHAWLVDRAGRTYPCDAALTAKRQFRAAGQLDPRFLTAREVIFDVRGEVDLVRFRVSLHPGRAGRTQDWRLA